ncbi:hypothetical protein CBL_03453 [Carabus blaptoides fortunei]
MQKLNDQISGSTSQASRQTILCEYRVSQIYPQSSLKLEEHEAVCPMIHDVDTFPASQIAPRAAAAENTYKFRNELNNVLRVCLGRKDTAIGLFDVGLDRLSKQYYSSMFTRFNTRLWSSFHCWNGTFPRDVISS